MTQKLILWADPDNPGGVASVNRALMKFADNGHRPIGTVQMRPATATSFDVAIWFLDRARAEDSYLPPRKLQCLLFLAQAHYAVIQDGQPLMPAFFVVDHGGPLDPNMYRALENGRPDITQTPLDEEILVFLEAVWRRYRDADALRLDQIVGRLGAGEEAVSRRDGSVVDIDAMRRMFGGRKKRKPPSGETLSRTHNGREVRVTRWNPARKITAR